jgi:hypothetical protein
MAFFMGHSFGLFCEEKCELCASERLSADYADYADVFPAGKSRNGLTSKSGISPEKSATKGNDTLILTYG